MTQRRKARQESLRISAFFIFRAGPAEQGDLWSWLGFGETKKKKSSYILKKWGMVYLQLIDILYVQVSIARLVALIELNISHCGDPSMCANLSFIRSRVDGVKSM